MSRSDEEFRTFVANRAASLHRTAYLLCGDWHLADDLVQEALAKAFRHWKRVQRADSPDAYVRRILVNEANRRGRARRDAVLRPEEGKPDGVTSDPADAVVDRAEMLEALLSLPPRQRATIVLRYLDGLSERETATALQCSEGTVKSQTSRALSTLNRFFTREELSRYDTR
jgi:RNA polymerase sigma-70 factor (sigma-E family)